MNLHNTLEDSYCTISLIRMEKTNDIESFISHLAPMMI